MWTTKNLNIISINLKHFYITKKVFGSDRKILFEFKNKKIIDERKFPWPSNHLYLRSFIKGCVCFFGGNDLAIVIV
jgi:hypothetical protein